MNLYYDVETLAFRKSKTDTRELSCLFAKRGDSQVIRILPMDGDNQYTYTSLTEMIFAVKANNGDTTPLILADTFTRDGATGFYVATLTQDTAQIETLIAAASDDFIDVFGELTATDGVYGKVTSRTVDFRVYDDVWKGTEGTPLEFPSPEEWLAENLPTITHAAASKATPVDLDEIPLADSAAAFGLKKLTWANLKATVLSGISLTWNALTGTANYVPLDTTPTGVPTTEGTLSWDADEGAPSYALPSGNSALNKEIWDYYTNLSGVAMVDGDIVSVVGATGNRSAVTLTNATNAASAKACIGMVTMGAANNGQVRVTKIGTVHGLNTGGLTEGGQIFVNPLLPGKWTQTEPVYPNIPVRIGYVQVAHASVGVVDVAVWADGYANAAQGAQVDAATSSATPETLVKRGVGGEASFATVDDAAVSGTASGTGIGTNGFSSDGTGSAGQSINGTGGFSATGAGDYHHKFGNESFVARVRGSFGWWRGIYNLIVDPVDALTANRVQRFSDKDGTIALTSDIANIDETQLDASVNASLDLADSAVQQTLTSVSITGAITLTGAAFGKVHICSGTSADYTVALPAVSGNAGKSIHFQMASALTKLVTLDGNGAETIDGAATRIMWAKESATLFCDGVGWVKTCGKSIPMFARASLATVGPSAQAIANATLVKVNFTATESDSTGTMSDLTNDRLIARRSGTYYVSGIISWDDGAGWAAARTLNRISKNSTLDIAGSEANKISGSYLTSGVSSILNLVSGDYIEINTYQNSGVSRNLFGDGLCNLLLKEEPTW